MKQLLYIDTTTDWIVLGLYNLSPDSIDRIAFYKASHPRESSFRLVKDIQELFKKSNLQKVDSLVCAYGPGSFTGLRIAVSTTRNLAQLWKSSCLGIDTLEIYSSYYFAKHFHPSFVLLDARMKKVYAGAYTDFGYKGSKDISPEDLEKEYQLSSYKLFSDFAFPNSLDLKSDYPEPDFIINKKINEIYHLDLTQHNYQTLTPHYIRGTYAEGKENGKIHT